MHYVVIFLLFIGQKICSAAPRALTPSTGKTKLKEATTDKLLQLRGGGADWRYFIAGGGAAAISHGITTPIDVVKTKMQGNPEKFKGVGLMGASHRVINEFGIMFLLAGLGPTFIGYGLEGAMKFGAYETCKGLFTEVFAKQFYNYLLASVVAGAIAAIILCPMEEVRIKMVENVDWKKESLISALLRLVKESGIFATFAGLPAMLSKQIPYTMGKQVSFDIISKVIRKIFINVLGEETVEDFPWLVTVCSAFVTSIIACICSQPGDMILTYTYKSEKNDAKDIISIANRILKERGLSGFFLGLQARLAHVAFIITSQLTFYDAMKILLGLPSTGSH